jgi:hypothetical protein
MQAEDVPIRQPSAAKRMPDEEPTTMPSTPKYRGSVPYMLVYAAHTGTTVFYEDIAALLGIQQPGSHMAVETGRVLGEISEAEHEAGRPMLSAVAGGVSGQPGEGFFGLAQELGRLPNESKEAKRQFWEAEKQAVYGTWQAK